MKQIIIVTIAIMLIIAKTMTKIKYILKANQKEKINISYY